MTTSNDLPESVTLKKKIDKITEECELYWKVLRDPDVCRNILIISLAIIAVAVFSYLSTDPANATWRTIKEIVKWIVQLFLASVTIKFYYMFTKGYRIKKFLKLVSPYNKGQNDYKYYIVLPRFSQQLLRNKNKLTEADNQLDTNGSSVKTFFGEDTDFAAVKDVISAMHVLSVFENLGISSPKIVFDDDVAKNLVPANNSTNTTADKTTYITIGLSNDVVEKVIDRK